MSPKLEQTETATATAEATVELGESTALHLGLLVEMHQTLVGQRKAIEAEIAKIQAETFATLEAAGVEKVRVGETPVSIVRGTTSSLDKQKFVALGGSLTMLAEATVTKPKKAYVRIGGGEDARTP